MGTPCFKVIQKDISALLFLKILGMPKILGYP